MIDDVLGGRGHTAKVIELHAEEVFVLVDLLAGFQDSGEPGLSAVLVCPPFDLPNLLVDLIEECLHLLTE